MPHYTTLYHTLYHHPSYLFLPAYCLLPTPHLPPSLPCLWLSASASLSHRPLGSPSPHIPVAPRRRGRLLHATCMLLRCYPMLLLSRHLAKPHPPYRTRLALPRRLHLLPCLLPMPCSRAHSGHRLGVLLSRPTSASCHAAPSAPSTILLAALCSLLAIRHPPSALLHRQLSSDALALARDRPASYAQPNTRTL